MAIDQTRLTDDARGASPVCSVVAYAIASFPPYFERLRDLAEAMPSVAFIAVIEEPSDAERDWIATAFESLKNVTVVALGVTLGKGAALRAGFNVCDTELVCFLDLDAVIDSAVIFDFIELVRRNETFDGAIGDRWLRRNHPGDSRRKAISRIFSGFAKLLFGISARDPQSPVKVFRSRALEAIFDDLRLYNHGFDVELLFQARRKNLRIVEQELPWASTDRPWPIVRTGTTVATALLALRLLTSPIGGLPGVALLGRHYVLPVKRKYSILLFSWRDPRHVCAGGAEIYLHEQAKHWTRAGHRVTWFAQRPKGTAARENIDGIEVVRFGSFPLVFLVAGLWYIFKSGRNYDCLIDCMNGIPFFTPLFSTKPKVCLVHHIHSHHFREELRFPMASLAIFVETKLAPFIYRNVRFMTVSASTKAEMEALGISRFPIEIIHNGVAPELTVGLKHPLPTVLYLGRLKKYKRVRKLIDAWAHVKRAVPNARLIVAGTGDDEKPLRDYASAKQAPDIKFLGRVSEDEKLALLRQAWVFGMPSEIEGWGIAVMEASACGTPAVIYRVRGLVDSVVEGETGLVADDDVEYATKISQLLVDERLRERMAQNCVSWAAEFSWERASQRTLDQIRISQPWYAVFEGSPDKHLSLRKTESSNRARQLATPTRAAKQRVQP